MPRSIREPLESATQRIGMRRVSARAHAGNTHAAGEVAIGKAHPRAAEAALIELLEMKARLERHALERGAHRPAALPPRPRRQPHRPHRPRAAELDGADDRAVAIDAAGAARTVKTIEGEKLAGHEASRRVGAERFRARQAGCEQGRNHDREPRNHTNPSPVTVAAATVIAR